MVMHYVVRLYLWSLDDMVVSLHLILLEIMYILVPHASTIAIFGKDTLNPLSYPANVIQPGNFFPFVARWEECDSNVLYAGVQNPKPVGAEVKIYPNPNNGWFTVVIASETKQSSVTMEIYNVMGEHIYSQSNIQNSQFNIDLSSQPAGVYFYRAITESGILIGEGKILVQK